LGNTAIPSSNFITPVNIKRKANSVLEELRGNNDESMEFSDYLKSNSISEASGNKKRILSLGKKKM